MARALSQEEVLDFLCQGGGKVPNASLLGHFKRFLRDPLAPAELQLKHREKFKRYVNSVAVVKQEGAVKYVVLRSRYRDLLGEDLRPPSPGQSADYVGDNRELEQVVPTPVHGEDHIGVHGEDHIGVHGEDYIGVHGEDHKGVHGEDYIAPQVGGGWRTEAGGRPDKTISLGQGAEVLLFRTSDHSKQSTVTPLAEQCKTLDSNEAINIPSHIPPSGFNAEHHSQVHLYSAPRLPRSPPNQTSRSSKCTSSHSSNPSSSCSPADSPALAPDSHNQTPSPASSGHWRHVPAGGTPTEVANPAFVNTTFWDLQEQRLSCMACTELQPPSHHPVGWIPKDPNSSQGEHNEYMQWEPHSDSINPTLSASPPCSRYIHLAHSPPSSLLLRQDSGISQPDVQLADYHTASPSPPLPDNDMRSMWMCQIPVFKSIRCQLSLQDLDDFVDQDSCGSEGSDSGEGGDCDTEHIEEDDFSSDSGRGKHVHNTEKTVDVPQRSPPNSSFINRIDSFNSQQNEGTAIMDPVVEDELIQSPVNYLGKSPYIAKSFLTDQAPILFQLAGNLPKTRLSSRAWEYVSSSEDEFIDRDSRKRRRPSRSKKSPYIPMVPPHPDIDRLLTGKSVSTNAFIVNQTRLPAINQAQTQFIPKENVEPNIKKPVHFKSSPVPLDSMEHDWIVKSASGSWLQVLGMFTMDPQLALRKDFISGYTVLHWFAKHGCMEMFQKVVAGTRKAGIELDMNVKSGCGYTPLHLAAIHGHHKVATMLVETHRANVKLRDNSGKRAWQYLGRTTSGEVWQLLGAPRGKTIFSSRALNTTINVHTHNPSSQLNRKTSLAAFLKPQHQKWKTNNNLPALREREIYSD